MTSRSFKTISFVALVSLALVGCMETTREKAALIGGGLGAGTGAIIGSQSDHAGAGTAIGAGIGIVTGYLAGAAMEDESKRAAKEEVAKLQAQQQGYPASYPPPQQAAYPPPPPSPSYEGPAAAKQMTKQDVINLANAGVSDDTIVSQIRSTASHFALSAQDIIELKNAGVSEKVINEMLTKR